MANYGPQDFDRRHNFNVNWVYELPKATSSRALGYALNGWQISGIYRYQTGAPYNVGFSIPGLSGYGVTGTPETIFIDRRGVVVQKVIGELTAQTLQSNLNLVI